MLLLAPGNRYLATRSTPDRETIEFHTDYKTHVTISTLARLVDLPTPLTPQNVITYGFFFCCFDNITSRNTSTRRRGDNICTNDSSKHAFTVVLTPSME